MTTKGTSPGRPPIVGIIREEWDNLPPGSRRTEAGSIVRKLIMQAMVLGKYDYYAKDQFREALSSIAEGVKRLPTKRMQQLFEAIKYLKYTQYSNVIDKSTGQFVKRRNMTITEIGGLLVELIVEDVPVNAVAAGSGKKQQQQQQQQFDEMSGLRFGRPYPPFDKVGVNEMDGFTATVMAEDNSDAAVADKDRAPPSPSSDEEELL
jgi:hypothetical protein